MRTRTFSKKCHSNLMLSCLSKSSWTPMSPVEMLVESKCIFLLRGTLSLKVFISCYVLTMPGRHQAREGYWPFQKSNNLFLCSCHMEYFIIELHREETPPSGLLGLWALGFVPAQDFLHGLGIFKVSCYVRFDMSGPSLIGRKWPGASQGGGGRGNEGELRGKRELFLFLKEFFRTQDTLYLKGWGPSTRLNRDN